MCLWQPSHLVWEKICTYFLVHTFLTYCNALIWTKKMCLRWTVSKIHLHYLDEIFWNRMISWPLGSSRSVFLKMHLERFYATGHNTHNTGCSSLPCLQKHNFACVKANVCLQLMSYLVCKISFAKDVLPGCKLCTVCIDDPLLGCCKAVWVEFAKDRHSCWRSAFLLDISVPSK